MKQYMTLLHMYIKTCASTLHTCDDIVLSTSESQRTQQFSGAKDNLEAPTSKRNL